MASFRKVACWTSRRNNRSAEALIGGVQKATIADLRASSLNGRPILADPIDIALPAAWALMPVRNEADSGLRIPKRGRA